QTTSLVPAPVWLASFRHLPSTIRWPPEKVHFWATVPLQSQMSTLLPLVVPPPKSSRHLPWTPLIGPLVPGDTVQVNVADFDAPVSSMARMVTLYVAAVLRIPEISPVSELRLRPAGRPNVRQVIR